MEENEKLAYLAGIIDGEGTISIAKQHPREGRKSFSYLLRISVTNTDISLSKWLQKEFGGSIHITKRDHIENHKNLHLWALGANDSYKLFKKIQPYSVIKQNQIKLAMEFYQKTILITRTNPLPKWLIDKKEDYYQRLKKMHL